MLNSYSKESRDQLKSRPRQDRNSNDSDGDAQNKNNQTALAELARTISEVTYGVVQVILQDGIIVQIDKTEKIRLK